VKRYPYMTDVHVKTAYLEEAEYILLEVMDCCLIVYQPYRPLLQIINVSIRFEIQFIWILGHADNTDPERRCTLPRRLAYM
jgi:hypothetical protein